MGAADWAGTVLVTLALFICAGLLEIGGGYLVWKSVRVSSTPTYYGAIGSILLIGYGFIVTLQPMEVSEFGRVYAAYGAIFIVMSCLWGAVFDKMEVDKGDVIGSLLCVTGACVVLFYPRVEQDAQVEGAMQESFVSATASHYTVVQAQA